MLVSWFYNLITHFFGGLQLLSNYSCCWETSLLSAATLWVIFFCSPICFHCLFHPLGVAKCSLIFHWSTWGPADFRPHQDSTAATYRLSLTLADDNLMKRGADEKADEFFLSPYITSDTDCFWHLSLLSKCLCSLVPCQRPFISLFGLTCSIAINKYATVWSCPTPRTHTTVCSYGNKVLKHLS